MKVSTATQKATGYAAAMYGRSETVDRLERAGEGEHAQADQRPASRCTDRHLEHLPNGSICGQRLAAELARGRSSASGPKTRGWRTTSTIGTSASMAQRAGWSSRSGSLITK